MNGKMKGICLLVDCVHGCSTGVDWEAILPVHGTAKYSTEVTIQQNGLLSRTSPISRLTQHQRRRSSPIKEINRRSHIILIGGQQRPCKIRCQIDGSSVENSFGVENTRDEVVVGHGVVTDDGGIDDEGEQSELVCNIVDFEKSCCVVVAVAS